ncbi:hypothetical protein LCGC14_1056130 [marine sediment metagenome]|uniref:Uncharacterized protein n=1 Tax=marine sediment metagenome TaxID=412755 RepID=A0A0F9MMH2_9ZZZZ
MSTYCDYCYSREHASWECPKLAQSLQRDVDNASSEELEAAADMWDRLVLTEDEKVRQLPVNPDLS